MRSIVEDQADESLVRAFVEVIRVSLPETPSSDSFLGSIRILVGSALNSVRVLTLLIFIFYPCVDRKKNTPYLVSELLY